MDIAGIAKCCHEANKALCEGIGDFSQKSWEEAESWQRESAMTGVEYFIRNPNAPDSAQHDAWVADKYKNGWVWGTEKNPDTKEHPCLVPFTELPKEQQAKDALFRAICGTLVPLLTNTRK